MKIRLMALAALLVFARSAAAALDYLCELHGAAQFNPGLSAATTPLNGPLDFAFQGDLTNCLGDTAGFAHLYICVVGRLNLPSCLGNQTEGEQFVICSNPCSSAPGGSATCDDEAAPLIDSHFSGVCAGTICAGSNPIDKAFYVVAFDVETVTAALAACDPATPGPPVTSGTFAGFEGRLQSLSGLPPAN